METKQINETILNETEAAKFLKVSRMTLIRKRQSGKLRFYRVGFRVLYSVEKHLQPFLVSCEQSEPKVENTGEAG